MPKLMCLKLLIKLVEVFEYFRQHTTNPTFYIIKCRQQQTVNYAVDMSPLTKFKVKFQSLYTVKDDTLNWTKTTATTALVI